MHQPSQDSIALRTTSVAVSEDARNRTVSNHEHTISDAPEDADGGKQAWLQVFGSFMVFVNIWGFTFIFGIFQSFYDETYLPRSSASSISWIGTVQSALLSVVGILAGPLYDLGLFRGMVMTGSALVLLGLFMLSLSTQYYQIFLSQGVAVGVGGGLLYVPSLALISGTFKRRRTLALGIVTCGIGIGGVVYVSAFQSLLPRLGFAWTVRVLGFIALGIFAVSIPTLILNTPSSNLSTRASGTRKLFDRSALTDPPFLAYAISSFVIFLGYLVPFFYAPSFAQQVLGMSRALSFWTLALCAATSIAGRIGAAFAAQRIGMMACWVGCCLLSSVLCFAWMGITQNKGAFIGLMGLYGFFSGALVALPPSVFPRIVRNKAVLGTWMGMGWLCAGVAFLVGAPLAGALSAIGTSNSEADINYVPVQVFSGLALMLGAAGLCMLWLCLVKLRGEKMWV